MNAYLVGLSIDDIFMLFICILEYRRTRTIVEFNFPQVAGTSLTMVNGSTGEKPSIHALNTGQRKLPNSTALLRVSANGFSMPGCTCACIHDLPVLSCSRRVSIYERGFAASRKTSVWPKNRPRKKWIMPTIRWRNYVSQSTRFVLCCRNCWHDGTRLPE